MNSQSDLAAWLGVAIAITGWFFIQAGIQLYHRVRFEIEYRKHPRLVDYDHAKACVEPHSWHIVELALRGLPPGQYQVCTNCGAISGNQVLMVSQEVLQQIREAQKILVNKEALEREIKARIDGITDAAVDRYIYKEFPTESRDLTFVSKLHELAEYSHEARIEAGEKVAAEIEAQKDLTHRYSGWESKVKGNA